MSTLRIGLRNLRRRPGRTALTCGMIGVSTLLSVVAVGVAEGTYEQLIDMATRTWTGQFQVQVEGYEDSPSLFESVRQPAPLLESLAARPEVVGVSPRVEAAGLLSVGPRTVGALVTGVDPGREAKLVTLPRAVKEGTWLAREGPDDLPIVLGRGLAERLGVRLGEEVTYLGQAADGSIAAEVFKVRGLLDSGSAEVDSALAFVRIEDAQELLTLGARVHRIVGLIDDVRDVDAVTAGLSLPEGLVALPWKALLPGLESSISADRAGNQTFISIIVFVVLLGITNSMLMSVFERTRELGIMMAIGTPPSRIISVVLVESMWLSLIGVVLGAAAGTGLIALLGDVGLQFSDKPIEFGGVVFDRAYPVNSVLGTVVVPGIILVVGSLAGLWPAWRAARLEPVAAIRQG